MLPALAVALPAAPTPEVHAPPRQPAAHPFAELLRQNQANVAPSPPERNASTNPEPSGDDGEPSSETENARPTDAQRERKLAQRAPANRRADLPVEAPAQPAVASTGERPIAIDDGTSDVPADPGMPAWLADWHPMPTESWSPRGDAAGGAAADEDHDSAAGAGHAKRAVAWHVSGEDRRGRALDDGAETQRFALSAAAEHLALARSASDTARKAIDKPVAMESSAASTPPLPSLPSLAMSAANGTASAAPVVSGVPTPFGSPDFAAAFGLQVSALARDGHHKAELHLNPSELGPVSVHIVVDGTQARIDFGADVAATRQAIEAGLPELASALRDAGLTLHGGGVSSHAGNAGGERRESAAGAHSSSDDREPEADSLRVWRTTPGGVDLYA